MDLYLDNRGYLRCKNSHELYHHKVAEQKLGRKLKPNEVVHHVNRNKLDNHPDNLYVCGNHEHSMIDFKNLRWEMCSLGLQFGW